MRLNSNQRFSPQLFLPILLCALWQLGILDLARAQNDAPLQLTLPQAIDLALKQNRDLKLAQLAVVDSQHKKDIAHSAYFPQIRNESTALHITELEGVVFPAGSFGSPAATGPIPSQSLVIDQGGLTAYTSGTGLAQPLTQMFKIRESNRAATADINSAKIQLDQAGNDVALKVRQLYFGILIAQLRQQAASEEVDAAQVKLQESTDSVERGRALEVVALESRAALQAVEKAKAGLAAAKDAYIPDVTALARYSYQSGLPFLVHNFGTFGFTFTYDLFDGGRRNAEIDDSRTLLSQAELNLIKIQEAVTVQVEIAYDKVEQLRNVLGVAEELLNVRTEAARVVDRQFEQNAALPSARADAHAKTIAAKASLLEANLGLSLAQGELKRSIGQIPR